MLAVAHPPGALFNAELLSVLDDLGVPLHLIGQVADLAGSVSGLCLLTREQLEAVQVPPKAARALLAAGKVARAGSERERLDRPSDAVSFIRARIDVAALEVEHAWVIALDVLTRAVALFEIAVGSLARVELHPREVFKAAIRTGAHSIILLHNHPSGQPEPSQSDILITERMVRVGRLMGLPVIDHIVLTATDHRSLAALGLMPEHEFED